MKMTTRKVVRSSSARAWKTIRNSNNALLARLFTSKATESTPYDSTITNLRLTPSTRVIFQGFTGRVGTSNAQESIAWGTNIVGGVKPNATPGQTHLDLPVLPTVREAVEVLRPHATGIYVAAHQAAGAIEEAIEAEIPLIVAVAEHIPVHSMLRIHAMLRTQDRCRLVGANAPGIISPIARCRIGFQPLAQYMPGPVGIVAKSGTLSYESVAALTRAGVGQSLCIGMGGDMVAGTDFVDALRVFKDDDDTKGIVIVGEVGGRAEEDAAEWIAEYRKNTANPKPIAAIVAGISNIDGRVFGHAGAWQGFNENDAVAKMKALKAAGVVMVDHPAKFGIVMKNLLSSSPKPTSSTPMNQQQKRSMHILSRSTPRDIPHSPPRSWVKTQTRSMSLSNADNELILRSYGVMARPHIKRHKSKYENLTGICIDRQSRQPVLMVRPASGKDTPNNPIYIPFDIRKGPTDAQIQDAIKLLVIENKFVREEPISAIETPKTLHAPKIPLAPGTPNTASTFDTERTPMPPTTLDALTKLYKSLYSLFVKKEAIQLLVRIGSGIDGRGVGHIRAPEFLFDDAAFRVGKRHEKLHSKRDTSMLDRRELAAEEHGIVYVSLGNKTHDVGTLVNGAGLAMNVVDALAARGVKATNFMDTGGLATSATVAAGFGLLLSDSRVKVIFVNIFGGLTLGDMIAEGIIMAFKEKDVKVPVVVRIRGTNEKEGQKLIEESGLSLFAYDDFEEAVAKVKELLRQGPTKRSNKSQNASQTEDGPE